MNFKFQPHPAASFSKVAVIRLGSSVIAAVPITCAADEVRAEELMASWREEHYAEHRAHYRDWDQYCNANGWWVSRVPVVG